MPTPLPSFALSHGQALWALAYGAEPSQRMKDRVRYLRTLGIPFSPDEQTVGRGNRMTYDYYHLVETGLGLTALSLGSRPADLVAVLVDQRADVRPLLAQAYLEAPEGVLTADWVASRGRLKPIINDEFFLRVHDKRTQPMGELAIIGPDEAATADELFEPVERYPGETPRRVIPLRRFIYQWVAWALVAPPTRPGRK